MRDKAAIVHHSHHQQSHMPAARNKPAKSRLPGVLLIDVKGLRVSLLRKLNDLLSGNDDLAQIEHVADLVIFGNPR